MSRYQAYGGDYGDYEGTREQILAAGRWEHNARAALKGKRGRKALAELREALMALPVHRLISGSMCTIGGAVQRVPEMTEREVSQLIAEYIGYGCSPEQAARFAEAERQRRAEFRRAVAEDIARDGEGVCVNAAYVWHKRVKEGMDPAEAFASLPLVSGKDDGAGHDQLDETAHLGEGAGLAYTLAWELAYRNDETFGQMTPEERHAAFIGWIDQELAA